MRNANASNQRKHDQIQISRKSQNHHELEPLHKKTIDLKISQPSLITQGNTISRHDSFDQKHETQSNSSGGKRRRKNDSNTKSLVINKSNSLIAGNVVDRLGSPRNIATVEDADMPRRMKHSYSSDYPNGKRSSEKRNTGLGPGDVQIPIERVDYLDRSFDRRRVNLREYSDPKVAYRLASNENIDIYNQI